MLVPFFIVILLVVSILSIECQSKKIARFNYKIEHQKNHRKT